MKKKTANFRDKEEVIALISSLFNKNEDSNVKDDKKVSGSNGKSGTKGAGEVVKSSPNTEKLLLQK